MFAFCEQFPGLISSSLVRILIGRAVMAMEPISSSPDRMLIILEPVRILISLDLAFLRRASNRVQL